MVTKNEVMEIVKDPQNGQGEKLNPNSYSSLSPLELVLMGSSVEVRKGTGIRLLTEAHVLEENGDFLLRPQNIAEGKKTQAQVLAERQGKYMEGYFSSVFASEEMWGGGYTQRIYLADLGEDEKIKPEFRVQLIQSDGEVVEDKEVVNRLLRVKKLVEYFRVKQDASGNTILEFTGARSKAEQPVGELV